ncbi:hypothetical protein FOZ63_005058, partial [Perkinsus olseni]
RAAVSNAGIGESQAHDHVTDYSVESGSSTSDRPSEWERLWKIAESDSDSTCDSYVDGSGTEEATLPLCDRLESTFEEWSKIPLVRRLLEIPEVRSVADELELLRGTPAEENQESFKRLCTRATEAAVKSLEDFFGVQRDPRDCADFHSEIWVSLMSLFEVKDTSFVKQMCTEGAPAGINIEIPSSNGLHPAAQDKTSGKIYRSDSDIPNYDTGIPHSEAIAEKLIRGEIQRNWMKQISDFPPGVQKTRIAVLPKKHGFEGEDAHLMDEGTLRKHYRIVEDYKRSNVNTAIRLSETTRLPTYKCLIHLLEWSARIVPNGAITFCGAATDGSASGIDQGSAAAFADGPKIFWRVVGPVAALLLLIPAACGISFSWHKLCVGKDNSFGGFRIESKKDKITGQIQEVLRSGVLTHATVESLIGRLLFCGQICPVYRCGLAVLYAIDRVMERKKLRKIKCSEKLRGNLERWIEVLDSSFTRYVRAPEFGETPITQQWLAVADASIDAIGAALIPRVGSNGFYSRVTTDELQTA